MVMMGVCTGAILRHVQLSDQIVKVSEEIVRGSYTW